MMPSRATWLASEPKCPKGEVSNIPGPVCAEPMIWSQEWQRWFCPRHGVEIRGVDAARRAGFLPWIEAA